MHNEHICWQMFPTSQLGVNYIKSFNKNIYHNSLYCILLEMVNVCVYKFLKHIYHQNWAEFEFEVFMMSMHYRLKWNIVLGEPLQVQITRQFSQNFPIWARKIMVWMQSKMCLACFIKTKRTKQATSSLFKRIRYKTSLTCDWRPYFSMNRNHFWTWPRCHKQISNFHEDCTKNLTCVLTRFYLTLGCLQGFTTAK